MKHIIKITRTSGTVAYMGNNRFDENMIRIKWVPDIEDAFVFETADALEKNTKRFLGWWKEQFHDMNRGYELIYINLPDIDALVNL